MADTRRGLMKRDVRSGRSTGFAGRSVRRGFTLIEVTVAMSILVVVVLALVSNYYAYYANVKNERYKTVGQNLAQLQLEDIQGMSVGVLTQIVKGDGGGWGYYPYRPADPSNPSDPAYAKDNYADTVSDPSVFDSGVVSGQFRVYGLTNISNLASASVPGMGIETISGTPITYNVLLYHDVYPGYTKKVVITDETPDVAAGSKKLFKIEVTVYWSVNGVQRHVTVTGLKNDMG